MHPKPTLTVIKQLYGTAFRCGEPKCRKPLYRLDDETGETVLNSEVAHIHARSEGGPRWDKDMSADENRSPGNLMPLCFDHAWSIDQAEADYPADRLLEWKAAQLAECIELQKSWSLTDAEAEEVERRSFDARENGYAAASAVTVMQILTEVGVLIDAARAQRRGPSVIAEEWRQRRAHINASSFMYDSETGERLLADLGFGERRQLKSRLAEALQAARTALEPSAVKVKGLALALSVDEDLSLWCDWVCGTTDEVLNASSRWPDDGAEEDGILNEGLSNLRRASIALGKKARGDEGEQPPDVDVADETAPEESEAERRGREHREVLEAARPWARVNHLDFDAVVYGSLLKAVPYALGLPTVISLAPYDLHATTSLAARIARNADDDTLVKLIDEARHMTPLAAASAMLWEISRVADGSGRAVAEAAATEALTDILRTETWQDAAVWDENAWHCRRLLAIAEHLLSSDHVREQLSAALDAEPGLIRPMLVGLVQWGESRDIEDGRLLGLTCTIRELPSWLPTEALVQAIHDQMPDVKALEHVELAEPNPEGLASLLLYSAGETEGS